MANQTMNNNKKNIYEITYHEDGTRTYYCKKSTRGIEVVMHVGGTPEDKQRAYEAVRDFYINN